MSALHSAMARMRTRLVDGAAKQVEADIRERAIAAAATAQVRDQMRQHVHKL